MRRYNISEQLINKQLRGFSLIELLVVIAIIAILTVVAAPSYKKSVMQTQVGYLWQAAVAAKMVVSSDFYKTYSYSNSNYAAGSFPFTINNNENIASIAVASGVVTVTGVSSKFDNKTIWVRWTPTIANNDLTWTCSFSTDAASFVRSDVCQ